MTASRRHPRQDPVRHLPALAVLQALQVLQVLQALQALQVLELPDRWIVLNRFVYCLMTRLWKGVGFWRPMNGVSLIPVATI